MNSQSSSTDAENWNELRQRLDCAIESLPRPQREAIVLHFLQELPVSEAARRCQCPEKTLYTRLDTAIKKLAGKLGCPVGSFAVILAQGLSSDLPCNAVSSALAGRIRDMGSAKMTVASPHAAHLVRLSLRRSALTSAAWAAGIALMVSAAVWFGRSELPVRAMGTKLPPSAPPQTAAENEREIEEAGALDLNGDPLPPGAIARLGTTRYRHHGSLTGFDQSGKLCSVGITAFHASGSIKEWGWGQLSGFHTWDVESGNAASRPCAALNALSPKRKFAATIETGPESYMTWNAGTPGALSWPSCMRVWDFESGRTILTARGIDLATLTFSEDETRFAALGMDGTIRQWELAGGTEIAPLQAQRPLKNQGDRITLPFMVKYASDLRSALVLESGSTAFIWDLAGSAASTHQPTREWPIPGNGVRAISPDHSIVAYFESGGVALRSMADGTSQLLPLKAGRGRVLSFSPDGTRLLAGCAVGTDEAFSTLVVWDLPSRKVLLQSEKLDYLNEGAFSLDGKYVAVQGQVGVLWIYDLTTGREKEQLIGHQGSVDAIAFAPSGQSIATVGGDRSIRFWDTASGRQTRDPRVWCPRGKDSLTTANVSSDSSLLVAADKSALRLLNPETGDELRDLPEETTPPNGPFGGPLPVGRKFVGLTHDHGRLLSLGQYGDLHIRDAGTGEELRCWQIIKDTHNDYVQAACFAPDGSVVAIKIGGWGVFEGPPEIAVWDLNTGKKIRSIEAPAGLWNLCISRNGKTLAYTNSKVIKDAPDLVRCYVFIDLASGEKIREIEGSPNMSTCHGGAAFSPDGKFFVVGSNDGSLQIYEWQSGHMAAQVKAHGAAITCLAFSPDGSRLVTGSADTTALVWDVSRLVGKDGKRTDF